MKSIKTARNMASATVVIFSLSSCAVLEGMKSGINDAAGNANASTSDGELMVTEKSRILDAREAELSKRAQELDKRESMLAAATSSKIQQPTDNKLTAGELLPPDAQPGQCFTRLWVPPEYETVNERVLVEEESERFEVIPASFQTVRKRVLVKEASEKLVTLPATYKTIKERVLVKEATKKLVKVDAVFEDVTERVIDKPAHTIWKKGTGPIQKIDETTGEIMCLVDVPATYKTVKKRVLKSPAGTRAVEIPAEYRTIEKLVVDIPATTRKIAVPAEYKTIEVTEEATPAQQRRIKIPAKYATVSKRKLIRDGKMDWREILCDTNMTKARITQIQQALIQAGYNPGVIDGAVGRDTMKAVNAFQRAEGLPVDRYLNIATVKALGVAPN